MDFKVGHPLLYLVDENHIANWSVLNRQWSSGYSHSINVSIHLRNFYAKETNIALACLNPRNKNHTGRYWIDVIKKGRTFNGSPLVKYKNKIILFFFLLLLCPPQWRKHGVRSTQLTNRLRVSTRDITFEVRRVFQTLSKKLHTIGHIITFGQGWHIR